MAESFDRAMSPGWPELDRWAHLLVGYFDGDANGAELNAALKSTAELRRLFVRMAMQTVALERLSREGSFDLAPPDDRQVTLADAPSKAAERKNRITLRDLVGATLAASVLLVAYVVVITWGMLDKESQGLRLEARAEDGRAADFASQDSSIKSQALSAVATITDERGAEWSATAKNSEIINHKSAITQGEPLELASGIVELKLKQGVTLFVEGPARWILDGDNRARLARGKLVAKVPERAIGFTVETPTARIVDLGTEFGVEVQDTGETDVRVLRGVVESSGIRQGDAQPPASPPIRLTAGQAMRFSPGNTPPVRIAADEQSFAKLLNRGSKSDAPASEDAYARAILADRPLAYWRLSDGFNDRASDASGNGHHGVYSGALHSNQPGVCPDNASIRVQGAAAEGWMTVSRLPVGPSFTIELWAKSATPNWNAHGWLGSARGSNGFIVHPYAGARAWQGYVFGDRATIAAEIGKHEPACIDDRFHHYAITYDADADLGGMYFDGELVVKKSPLLAPKRRSATAEVNLTFGYDPGAYGPKLGDGWIDEVAVYDRALSGLEVAKHFDAVKPTE